MFVIPAKAGIQSSSTIERMTLAWVPTYVGMTAGLNRWRAEQPAPTKKGCRDPGSLLETYPA